MQMFIYPFGIERLEDGLIFHEFQDLYLETYNSMDEVKKYLLDSDEIHNHGFTRAGIINPVYIPKKEHQQQQQQ